MVKNISLLNGFEIGTPVQYEAKIIDQLFYNEENQYGVYRIEHRHDKKATCIISGHFPYEVNPSFAYIISGTVSAYKDEKQIKLETIYIVQPETEADIVVHFKQLKGINKVASLIVKRYGLNSISYCMNHPHEVSEDINSITLGLAQTISMELQLRYANIDIREQLKLWSFTEKQAEAIAQRLGQSALIIIRKNPYELIQYIHGIGFKTIDKLAVRLGFERFSEVRVKAAIRYCLVEAANQGHCYMQVNTVLEKLAPLVSITLTPFACAKLLGVSSKEEKHIVYEHEGKSYRLSKARLIAFMEQFDAQENERKREHMNFMVEGITSKQLLSYIKQLAEDELVVLQDERIYLKDYYIAEYKLAYKIIQLLLFEGKRLNNESIIDAVISQRGYKLEHKQLEAVKLFSAQEGGFMILNGSAGCGKTFTLNVILEVLEKLYEAQGRTFNVNIMAPTGKAAQVASLATGRAATTIHRGLKWKPDGGFEHHEQSPLTCDCLVIDEASMLDLRLAYQLSKAIPPHCKVIIMGDTKQLQSVGAGNVLHDLIATQLIPIVTLDVIKRQGKDSGIIDNARRIIQLEMIKTEQDKGDSFVIDTTTSSQTLHLLIKGIQRLIDKHHYEMKDIQVLSPMRKGMLGVDYLNFKLQQAFNNQAEKEASYLNKLIILPDEHGDLASEEYEQQAEDQEELLTDNQLELKAAERHSVKRLELHFLKGDKVIHLVNDYKMEWFSYEDGEYSRIAKQGITNGECGIIFEIKTLYSQSSNHKQVRVTVKYDEGYVHYLNPGAELDHCYAMTIHKSQGSQWPAVFMPVDKEQKHMLNNSLVYTGFTRAKQFQCVIGDSTVIKQAIGYSTVDRRLTSLRDRFMVDNET